MTATLDIEQIFTSFNNPKGNAETARFMRTLKEELLWLEEFADLEEAREKLSAWVETGATYSHNLANGLDQITGLPQLRGYSISLQAYPEIF